MADKPVTFFITVTAEEHRKLCEMVKLENVSSINEVYKIALNRNYRFLKSVKEMANSFHESTNDVSAKNRN